MSDDSNDEDDSVDKECIACFDVLDVESYSSALVCHRCGSRVCLDCASRWRRGCPVCREKFVWMSKLYLVVESVYCSTRFCKIFVVFMTYVATAGFIYRWGAAL